MLYSYLGVIWVSDEFDSLREINLSSSIPRSKRSCAIVSTNKSGFVAKIRPTNLYSGEKSGNGRWVIRAEGSGRSRVDIVVGKYPDVPQKAKGSYVVCGVFIPSRLCQIAH